MSTKQTSILSFVVVTICFALWGFANDITNPMVKAFSKIFKMSTTDGALVQMAFYGGYFVLALPAALFIRRFSYKAGITVGLFLFAVGAFMFLPAARSGEYHPFLIAYFVLTCGLSFLETSANPYILTMGEPEKAAYRLNLAQSFNPLGSLLGMFVAMKFVQEKLSPLSSLERASLSDAEFELVKHQDLVVLSKPYLFLGIFVLLLFVLIHVVPVDKAKKNTGFHLGQTLRRVMWAEGYKSGFVAQFFYVGAQIMCWTFIIQYGTEVFCGQGMSEIDAEVLSQKYNIAAMILFCGGRFACTFMMKYISPAKLLAILAAVAVVLTMMIVVCGGVVGMYSLVGVSGCMSLMFPTIYSIALGRLDAEDAKIGAAGQIMAILGGSLMPALQAAIIDRGEVSTSFLVPTLSFVVIALYAVVSYRREKKRLIPETYD